MAAVLQKQYDDDHLPQKILNFTFPPLETELAEVEKVTGSKYLYPINFRLKVYRYNNLGNKVLLVSDRASSDDISPHTAEIFYGKEGTVLDKTLEYINRQRDQKVIIKEIVIFNFAFAFLYDEKKQAAYSTVYPYFYARLKRFIRKYKPDTIIISGSDVFHYIMSNITGDFETNHLLRMNRVLDVEIVAGLKTKLLGTVDCLRPFSWDPKYTGEFPHLLGYWSNGVIQALNGRNRYNIQINPEHIKFEYIDTIKKFKAFYQELIRHPHIAIDTETQGLARIQNCLYSIQFSWSKDQGYFIPVSHPETPFSSEELDYIKKKLKYYFEFGKSDYHIYQYGKFDVMQFLAQLGVRFYNHRIYDIQAAEFTLEENRKHLKRHIAKYSKRKLGMNKAGPYSLDFIAEQYGCDIYSRIEFSKGNRGQISQEGLTRRFIEYACYDVIVPIHIIECQLREAKRQNHDKFLTVVCEQLSDTILAFTGMEHTGALIDRRHLFDLKAADGPLAKMINDQLAKIKNSKVVKRVNDHLIKKTGAPAEGFFTKENWIFDITKQKHQQLLFFNALRLKPVNLTKTGQGKVNKEFQKKYGDVSEVASFSRWKRIRTIRDMFANGIFLRLNKDPDAKDSHVRSSYDYLYVTTGRTSSLDPNLQNIPTRGDLAKYIKRLFVAPVGYLLLEDDFSAHEVRDWANEAGDQNLADAFHVGMKLRQELRKLSYTHQNEAAVWLAHKKKLNWKEIKELDKKQDIIKTIKNPIINKIAKAELELELKGDLHRQNCTRFFRVDALKVTPKQRDEIKAVIFGVIYEKGASGLALTLGVSEEYAQQLIDGLFTEFPDGKKFIDDGHEFASNNLFVESPVGIRRHLWGYLHTRPAVINAMNRRTANSIIQGIASNFGISSIRIRQKLLWNFFVKHGVDLDWKVFNNYVHDSTKSMASYHNVPLMLYLSEHAATTLLHRRFERVFGYKLTIGLELEFHIGPALSDMAKWSFFGKDMLDIVEGGMAWQEKELGYEIPNKSRTIKILKHNWRIISAIRLREIEKDMGKAVPTTMLMNSKNARSLNLIIQ